MQRDSHSYPHSETTASFSYSILNSQEIQQFKSGDYVISFPKSRKAYTRLAEQQYYYLFRPYSIVLKSDEVQNFEDLDYHTLQIPEQLLKRILLGYRGIVMDLNPSASERLIFRYDEYTKSFTENLMRIAPLEPSLKLKMLNYKIQELLTYLIETSGVNVLRFLLNDSPLNVSRFNSLVAENSLSNLKVEEIAFTMNMSVSKFKREFRKLYNDTPMNWIRKTKMHEASKLLLNTKMQVGELSEYLGFKNPSGFIQVFKKTYELTPKQYRIKHL